LIIITGKPDPRQEGKGKRRRDYSQPRTTTLNNLY
jgi:hypothetical protein